MLANETALDNIKLSGYCLKWNLYTLKGENS